MDIIFTKLTGSKAMRENSTIKNFNPGVQSPLFGRSSHLSQKLS